MYFKLACERSRLLTCMSWDETLVKDGRANLAPGRSKWWYSAVFNMMWNHCWGSKSLIVQLHSRPLTAFVSCLIFVLETCWFCVHAETWEWCCGTRGEQKSGGVGCFWGMRPPPPPGRNWGGIITRLEEDWWRVESTEGGNIIVAAGKTEACRRHKMHPIIYIWGFKAQFSQLWRVFQRQSPVEVRAVSIYSSVLRCVVSHVSLNDGWM